MLNIGDIVKFKGENARILGIDNRDMSLSGFGWLFGINQSDLELVESAILPKLKDGDLVYVHDIPEDEKLAYGTIWMNSMNKYVTTEADLKIGKAVAHLVKNVRWSQWYGPLVTIGGYVFQTYHLEPINNYDMI